MELHEIKEALYEAARQSMLDILEEEMHMENMLSDLPETAVIISIIRKQMKLAPEDALPEDFKREEIINIAGTIRKSLGDAVAEAFKEVVKQPKLMKALKTLFSTHSDFESMEPVLSKRYSEVLLDFMEKYLDSPNWVKTQAILIITDTLVKNVTGAVKPRLYARMDVNWGIYLWKCGDYSEAERKFQKSDAAVSVLMKKHGKTITSPGEILKDRELQMRIFQGFGALYGDLHQDKSEAIGYYTRCLEELSKLELTYRHKKMMTSILNNLGVTHHRMSELHPEEKVKHLNRAAEYYEQGLDIARSIHHTNMVGWILFNAGEVYAQLGRFDDAERCSRESRKIFTEDMASERGLSGVEMLDAVIHLEKKEYTEALACIERSIELREKLREPRRIADAMEFRGDIYLASGNSDDAIKDYRISHSIYRSIGSDAGVKRTEGKIRSAE